MRSLLSRSLIALSLLIAALASPLLAQAVASPATTTGKLALAILQPVVGWISNLLYDGFKTILPWWDARGATVHMVAAPVLAFLFGFLASHAGFGLIADLGGVDAAWFNGGLVALVSAGIFRFEKRRAPTDATTVLARTR